MKHYNQILKTLRNAYLDEIKHLKLLNVNPKEGGRTLSPEFFKKDTDWESVVQAIQNSDKLLKATWNKDADLVAEGIDKVQGKTHPFYSTIMKNALSCVITLAYYNAVNRYNSDTRNAIRKGIR